MRFLDVLNDGGALLLLGGVADCLINSGTLLAIDSVTDLFRNDAVVGPALFSVVNLTFLRDI